MSNGEAYEETKRGGIHWRLEEDGSIVSVFCGPVQLLGEVAQGSISSLCLGNLCKGITDVVNDTTDIWKYPQQVLAVKLLFETSLSRLQYPQFDENGLAYIDSGWTNALIEVQLLMRAHCAHLTDEGMVICDDPLISVVRPRFVNFRNEEAGREGFFAMSCIPYEVITLNNCEQTSIEPIFTLLQGDNGRENDVYGLYTEGAAKELIRDILVGLQGIHSRRIVHKDIKPSNLRRKTRVDKREIRVITREYVMTLDDERIRACSGDIDVFYFDDTMMRIVTNNHGMHKTSSKNFDEFDLFPWKNNSICFSEDEADTYLKETTTSADVGTGVTEIDDDEYNAVIIDFNSASHIPEEKPFLIYDAHGTRGFIPPECLLPGNKTEEGKAIGVDGEKRDVWSAGITLYCLLFGRPPYWCQENGGSGEGLRLIFQVIDKTTKCVEPAICPHRAIPGIPDQLNDEISASANDNSCNCPSPFISSECSEFISMLLTKDPSDRLSVKDALSHKWLITP